jgi:hypothetical protein
MNVALNTASVERRDLRVISDLPRDGFCGGDRYRRLTSRHGRC